MLTRNAAAHGTYHDPSIQPSTTATCDQQTTQNGLLMLLTPRSGQDFASFTTGGFYKAVRSVVGTAMLLSSRSTVRGGLLVEVGSADAARKLFRTDKLCGVAVDVHIPRSDQRNVGLIHDVTKWYTDEEIAEQLSSQGVVHARRVRTRVREGSTSELRAEATDKVMLVFMPNEERPRSVKLNAVDHEVEEYVSEVPQCFHCQRMGHVSKHCQFNTRCARCSGPHPTADCQALSPVRCANCGQGHFATWRNCPARLKGTVPEL
ncbi:hypothetical protein V5799_022710 [Amblyomma americanum]|uniref:CCHC-type domain-containing protein n=1 Tax=Amblyomma americanum TaxID=6943 RepID=A0AAQ4FJZ8_AMBAM